MKIKCEFIKKQNKIHRKWIRIENTFFMSRIGKGRTVLRPVRILKRNSHLRGKIGGILDNPGRLRYNTLNAKERELNQEEVKPWQIRKIF